MDMKKYQKNAIEYSSDVVDSAERKRKHDQRYQDRFNYYNAVVATLALIISIIALLK